MSKISIELENTHRQNRKTARQVSFSLKAQISNLRGEGRKVSKCRCFCSEQCLRLQPFDQPKRHQSRQCNPITKRTNLRSEPKLTGKRRRAVIRWEGGGTARPAPREPRKRRRRRRSNKGQKIKKDKGNLGEGRGRSQGLEMGLKSKLLHDFRAF